MSWQVISIPAEYDRYKKQLGVNVFGIYETAADPQEVAQIEKSMAQQFEQQVQNTQVRFYKTEQKLSDSGGVLRVFLNGKKLDQEMLTMVSLNRITEIVKQALAQEQ